MLSSHQPQYSNLQKQLEKEPYENLPEDTSLMRGLKKLYLDGGHIYAYAGLIPEF